MEPETRPIARGKRIALVAHDGKKPDLVDWATFNRAVLSQHVVYATGTTGGLLEKALDVDVIKLQSDRLGGDQQIGAKIAEGETDSVVVFSDPLEAQPHEVKALLRLAAVRSIPLACNRASADFMFSSPVMTDECQRLLPDRDAYRIRMAEQEAGW